MKIYLILMLVICSLQTATAGMYKCKNIDAQISYSDKPCVAAKAVPLNLPYFSSYYLKSQKIDTLKKSSPHQTPESQTQHSFLNDQESKLLKQINRREKQQAKLERWKEKQRFKSALKETARQKKQKKLNFKKCTKYKNKLKKVQDKARSGYRASESNRINNAIDKNKKYIIKYCE